MHKRLLIAFAFLLASSTFAATPQPALSEPSLSPDASTIVFVAGGDIWSVPSSGGEARLLVANPATESRPLFSSRYLLRGSDETAIRAAFTNEAMATLEQQPGWVVEVKAGNVGIYRAGRRVNPADVGTFVEQSHALVRAFMAR